MNELVNLVSDKVVMFVAAHHDDEVFVFGSMLALCLESSKSIVISVMSNIRLEKFTNMCNDLGVTGITHDFEKYGKDKSYYVEDIFDISSTIKRDMVKHSPDVIVTHSNRIENSHYHPYHTIVNLATKYAVDKRLPIVVRTDLKSISTLKPTDKSKKLFSYYLGEGKNKWKNTMEIPQHYDILEAKCSV